VSDLLVTSEDMQRSHSVYFGVAPSVVQARLYSAFPQARGYSSSALDPERFDATLIMALVQTYRKGTLPTNPDVLFFVPASHEQWAIGTLKESITRMFTCLKGQHRQDVAKTLSALFKHIHLGNRVLQFVDAPARWAAFGFTDADPIPAWLRSGLVEG